MAKPMGLRVFGMNYSNAAEDEFNRKTRSSAASGKV